MRILAGIDIGGTKSAVCLGIPTAAGMEIIAKKKFPTPGSPAEALRQYVQTIHELLQHTDGSLAAIGISCGGPMDSKRGLIFSPPNLPLWDRTDILQPFREQFGVPTVVQNDANACAVAEWQWGAGKGYDNIVFLTFGTGMGAGLILNGQLYSGTTDMAGEVGHVRLENEGPFDYGKTGTFSGFCSGGSIPRMAAPIIEEEIRSGRPPAFCPTLDRIAQVTTEEIGLAAQGGDPLALRIFDIVARKLGQGISMLIDILNPERVVIGSIYVRQQKLIQPAMLEVVRKETLRNSLDVCQIVPSSLGEQIGDYASLSVAWQALEEQKSDICKTMKNMESHSIAKM